MDVAFGELLRGAREAAGLSQQELAERAGLTVNGISQLERGVRTRPYPHTVRALADALDLPPAERTRLFAAVPSRSRGPAAAPGAGRAPTLPAPPTALVDRDTELAAVAGALHEVRVLTITGPGGVGKTALALTAARSMASRFPDGVVFVALADVEDTAAALRAVGQALGLVDTGAAHVREQLRAALQGTRRLLVLDNVEHLPGLSPEVAALVAELPEVTVLATSRAPLRIRAETELHLYPLSVPPSTDAQPLTDSGAGLLLVRRARAHHPHFEPTDVEALADICRRLDGLPLAIELAAPWLRVLTPRQLADRLSDALPLLTEGPGDLPARHRTMRATIAWSDDLLEPAERVLFHRLAVLPGPWDLETAAAVADRPEPEVLRGIAALAERSLVQRAGDDHDGRARFRLLETVRAYGLEQLQAHDDADAARMRHADAVAELVDRASTELDGPDQARWLHRVEDHLADVRALLRWAVDGGATGIAARCYGGLQWTWFLRHATEGRSWGEEILARTGEADPVACAHVEGTLALLCFATGDLEAAGSLARRAAGRWDAAGDEDALVGALSVHAAIAVASGDPQLCAALARRVRAAAADRPSRAAQVAVVSAILSEARAALAVGDFHRADELLALADDGLVRIGTPWLRLLWVNITIGADQARDRHDRTPAHLRRALELCQELGDAPALLYTLSALAIEFVLTDRFGDAARLFGAAEAHGRRTGQRISDPLTLQLLQAHRAHAMRALGEERYHAEVLDGGSTPVESLVPSMP